MRASVRDLKLDLDRPPVDAAGVPWTSCTSARATSQRDERQVFYLPSFTWWPATSRLQLRTTVRALLCAGTHFVARRLARRDLFGHAPFRSRARV